MNRTGVALSAMLAVIGGTQILFPESVAQLFALDTAPALLAVLIAVIAYGAWFGPLKFVLGSWTIRIIGLATFMIGLSFIISPTIFGLRAAFLPIADIFLIIESGVMLQLLGLEKKQSGSLVKVPLVSMSSQLQRRLHHGPVTVSASR